MDIDRECVYVQGRGEECSRVIEEKEDHFPGWWVVFPCWQGTREEGKEKKRKGGQTRWKQGEKKENIEAVNLRGRWGNEMFEGDLEAAVLEQRGGAIVCGFIGDRPCDWEGDRDRTRWILKEQQPQHFEDWGSHHPWHERARFWKWEQVQLQPHLDLEEYFGRTIESGER